MAKSRVVVGGLLALSFLVACERGAANTGPACDKVASQIITVLTKGKQDVHSMETKPSIVRRCTVDKWSSEARTCIEKADSREDLKKCTHDTLTGEQDDRLKDSTKSLGSNGEVMAKMREFADKMCACKDGTCAQKVADEMTKWGQEMSKEQNEPPQMSEDETKQATEIGQRMGECMTKALGGDLGQLPPSPDDPPRALDKPEHELKEGDMTPDGRVIVK